MKIEINDVVIVLIFPLLSIICWRFTFGRVIRQCVELF